MPGIEYNGKFFEYGTDVTPAIRAAARRANDYGMMLIRGRTPVDTGRLKSGWEGILNGNGFKITNPTPYTSYVEFGTRRMAARGMLTRSIPDINAKFQQELKKEIGKSLGAKIITRISEDVRLTQDALAGKARIGNIRKGFLR